MSYRTCARCGKSLGLAEQCPECSPTSSELDAEVVTNPKGGKQSKITTRLDLIDPETLIRLGEILAEGSERYGDWNWLNIDMRSNLNHALRHIMLALDGNTDDDHLGHAFCRLMFACRKQRDERKPSE